MADYYTLLEVGRNATQQEIRQAYRRLARQYHPDVNSGEKASEEKFKEINEAYGVLSDEDKRRRYDKYGDNWARSDQMDEAARARRGGNFSWSSREGDDSFSFFGADGGGVFDGLFGDLGRQANRPPPAEYAVEVTLEEAYKGTARLLTLSSGRRLEVKIPQGVDEGSRIHVSPDGNPAGDLYLITSIKAHQRFSRQGRDLYTEVEASLEDAILGGDVKVPSLGGQLALTLPPETQNGRRFRLAGRGMPVLNNTDAKGDLYATVKVTLPMDLSPEEQDLFHRLKELRASKGR